ncbi:MAG: class I SAM-dependent methyltransferase [Planctomycetes bacterium]|nr:class I SAM-dependent methyltransferase [Planctomycetota bacterium]
MDTPYRSDLAYIHDTGFGHIARGAAACLLDHLRKAGAETGRVVELGCGSGISTEAIVAAGYDVLGFDISEDMLALARQRVPRAEFRTTSFLTAELPSCIAVTAIGECLNYRFDANNTKRAVETLFHRIHDALQPGGLLLFDVAETRRVPGSGPQRNWWEGEDWAVLVEVYENRTKRLLTRQITSFRKVGELYRRDHEIHRLQLFERSALKKQLQGIGFRVRLLSGYGQPLFAPGHIGFLARKRRRS